MSLRRFPLALSAATLVAALALTGCTPEEPAPTTPATTTPAATPTPSAEPTETQAPATSTPVTTPCDALISLQTMYDFNPNFSLLSSWNPDAGSAAAAAASAKGAVCRWQNDTSGETIDISVASFDKVSLESMANDTYDDSTMVPTYGGEGYFAVVNGAGEAVVFDRAYWVVLRSAYFMEPGDAEALMTSVLSALP